jgi:hypothetical protein
MIVLPGCELTQNRFRRNDSAHVLALGIDSFVSADGTVEEMLARARKSGAVVVACHPHEQSDWFSNTFYLWNRRTQVADLIHLWELACRWDLFPPVARARLPFIGNSDFHDRSHLFAWKTLLPCEKRLPEIINVLKKGAGLAVTRMEPETTMRPLAVPAMATAWGGMHDRFPYADVFDGRGRRGRHAANSVDDPVPEGRTFFRRRPAAAGLPFPAGRFHSSSLHSETGLRARG